MQPSCYLVDQGRDRKEDDEFILKIGSYIEQEEAIPSARDTFCQDRGKLKIRKKLRPD